MLKSCFLLHRVNKNRFDDVFVSLNISILGKISKNIFWDRIRCAPVKKAKKQFDFTATISNLPVTSSSINRESSNEDARLPIGRAIQLKDPLERPAMHIQSPMSREPIKIEKDALKITCRGVNDRKKRSERADSKALRVEVDVKSDRGFTG